MDEIVKINIITDAKILKINPNIPYYLIPLSSVLYLIPITNTGSSVICMVISPEGIYPLEYKHFCGKLFLSLKNCRVELNWGYS